MTPKVHAKLVRSLNAMALKVYESVPASEPWATSMICGAMPGNPDINVVKGCLGKLKADGLIKEVSRSRFIQVEVKASLSEQLKELNLDGVVSQETAAATGKENLIPQGPQLIHTKDRSVRTLRPPVWMCSRCNKEGAQDVGDGRIMHLDCAQKDTAEALEQAEEMNRNMRQHGTIDAPQKEAPVSLPEKPDTLTLLAALAEALRSQAEANRLALVNIAAQIDEVALEVTEQREQSAAAVDQLAKIRSALAAAGAL
jgi:hypothetical protein